MKARILLVASTVGLLAGCPDDGDNITKAYSYTVTVTNLTANQPLSPLALLTHNKDFSLFQVGQAASVAVEQMAEGGSNAEIIALANSEANVDTGSAGNGLILPGNSDSITITLNPYSYGYLSIASMLVNTNDAFIGETGVSLKTLAKGESMEMNMNVWDAGTELNDELAATIPGPAGGGEGFNATRNDTNNSVTFHSGVITKDDGLANSALSATHRFANPGAKLTITRTN